MIEPQKWASTLGSLSDTVTLPDEDLQFASFKKLFPALTQVPLSEGGVAPQRTDFNTLFKLLGDNIFYLQQGGVFSYSDTANYERGAFVKYNNELYLCIQDNSSSNKHAPTDAEYWKKIALNSDLANYLPLAGGNITGNLTVQNKNIDVIEEQGDKYIRYSSGLQICWGEVGQGKQQTITFPKSFSIRPGVSVTINSPNADAMATIDYWTAQAVTVFCNVEYYGIHYIAIGRWK